MNDPTTIVKCPCCEWFGHNDDCEICEGTGDAWPQDADEWIREMKESRMEDEDD